MKKGTAVYFDNIHSSFEGVVLKTSYEHFIKVLVGAEFTDTGKAQVFNVNTDYLTTI